MPNFWNAITTKVLLPNLPYRLGIQVSITMKTYARSQERWGSPYYENGTIVEEQLSGCDSKHIVDRTRIYSPKRRTRQPF